jgi:ATP-dependent Clp protease protease subunit
MHPMLKLLASNRKRGLFKAEQAPESDSATLYLYDMIVDTDEEADWWGGISPGNFVRALHAMTAPEIHLRVKSPGGSVFAARAMEQAIREHSSKIITHVDGLAASAASFLILPSDEIIVAPGSFIMIHKAWTIAYGNEDDFIKSASLLAQIDGSLVKSYAEKTGQSEADIAAWMKAETWFEAEKAVELGFADRVATKENSASAVAMKSPWDLSAFLHAPASAATAEVNEPEVQPQPQTGPQVNRAALHRAALKALIPA